MKPGIRELPSGEAYRLEECLRELAAHHNEVSAGFSGCFPKRPYRETIRLFEEDTGSGRSRIAVIEDGERILGFCKADIRGEEGEVAYLVVLKEARGKGCGEALLGWALETLEREGASRIEVRVVDGNDAAGFYEKNGFRVCSHILRKDVR